MQSYTLLFYIPLFPHRHRAFRDRLRKKYKKSWGFENNISKKSLPLRRFNKAIDCITFFKVFDGSSYRSSIFRILW